MIRDLSPVDILDEFTSRNGEQTVVQNPRAINNCNTNSDKSLPNGLLPETDSCPKTENSDSDKSPFRAMQESGYPF